MPRTGSARDVSYANRFVYALVGDRLKLCDAKVVTQDGVEVLISRLFLANSCLYFREEYLVNGKGPLPDTDSAVEIPVKSDVFGIVLEFFYSSQSPYINSVKNLIGTTTGERNLEKDCKLLIRVAHAAAFFQCDDLVRECGTTIQDFTRQFPAVACMALEELGTRGHGDKEDPVIVSIYQKILANIAESPDAALQVPHEESDSNSQNPARSTAGILKLSSDSLGSVVKVISKKPTFAIRSIFFWATKGTRLSETTKNHLRNPSPDMENRALQAKQLIKTLPLKALKPDFVSSFIFLTDLVDKDTALELIHAALKNTLVNLSRTKDKLRTVRRVRRGRTNDSS